MNERSQVILLVEDDDSISEPLIFGLKKEKFQVLHATDGSQALELAYSERPDIVILDVMLPRIDGFTVCKTLRKQSSVPILMLTARDQEMDRVMGLEIGADDYITKPFSFRELIARIKAILRRQALDRGEASPANERFKAGTIVMDHVARRVWKDDSLIEFRQREFELLTVLMKQVGQAISRDELLSLVWGDNWIGDSHTLDVHIRWLREKLEDDPSNPRYIQTIRGYGYRLVDPDESQTDS